MGTAGFGCGCRSYGLAGPIAVAGVSGGVSGYVAIGKLQGALLQAAESEFFLKPGGTEVGSDLISLPTTSAFIYHGLVGGLFTVAGGGKFGAGFLAAGFGSLADKSTFDTGDPWGNTLVHALAGGVGSTLGGGKFANGAATAAFAYVAGNLEEFENTMGRAEEGPSTRSGTGGGPRVLTQGEMDIAKTEFPDLNTDPLRITYDESGNTAYTPDNTMHFPESVSDCSDFSTCDEGKLTAWFVHELTHTWQYQNGISPFWGHIFSSDVLKFGDYYSRDQYFHTPDPSNLTTEQQGDWHSWHYICTTRPSC